VDSVATSSPFASKNRFDALETEEESDAGQFREHRSKRPKRRRLPTSPQQQQQSVDNQQHQ